MIAQTHNASADSPEATGTVRDGHKSLGENMSTPSMTDRDEKRIKSCADALAALERIHGTRALAQGIEQFEHDKDYRERFWAAMPERRDRMARLAEECKQRDGITDEDYQALTRPVTAEPLPPVDMATVIRVAREVADEDEVDRL